KNLKELNISFTGMSDLPYNIVKLKKLRFLDCHGNNLTKISKELGELDNLQTLYLMDNQISAVDPNIKKLVYLEHMSLTGNRLTDDQIQVIKGLLPNCEVDGQFQRL
ncbi:MAG: leucine-rich repeat domain-containing protein, partial [Bacteroidota bacterium]